MWRNTIRAEINKVVSKVVDKVVSKVVNKVVSNAVKIAFDAITALRYTTWHFLSTKVIFFI